MNIPDLRCSCRCSRFTDSGGATAALAVIPRGWSTSGDIDASARRFAAGILAEAPDGLTKMFANTGEAFRQIKRGLLESDAGDEAGQLPLRAFTPPADYLDQTASALLGCEFDVTHALPLPRELPENLCAEYERRLSGSANGLRLDIQNVFSGGAMRVYRFASDGGERCLALAAEMHGVEYSYSPAPPLGLGALEMNGCAPGGSADDFGHAPVSGALAAYVDWESAAVFGMLCRAPLSNGDLDGFCAFVRSCRFTPPARGD